MQDLIDDLERRRQAGLALGGADKVARQRKAGKHTVRERVAMLFDPDSVFEEVGQLATHAPTVVTPTKDKVTPADGVVTGFGRVDGRT
ncbi:MAG: methylmalonyl-CoA carboxyltransferase, partial [Roseibium sp.]|uniref:carboxyl transferase domain-containing protein n=1 Tax=Roseibium sp. TaxID=1936156 RepID=UPI001B002A54